jgi:hypothetical protein
MSSRYGDWRDDAILQLKCLTADHQQQRTQLELTLETTPRDSRYSANLVGLMKAEEENPGKDKASIYELNRKVDEALSLETHKFFERTAAQNIKRWKALSQKIDLDREKYRLLLSDTVCKINPNHGPIVVPANGSDALSKQILQTDSRLLRIPTNDDLDEESLRLEQDYNRNFLAYEGFNLSEAFKSHKLKVDKDWGVHELLLEEDYKSRRFSITGYRVQNSTHFSILQSTYIVFFCCYDSGNEELRATAAPLADAQENRWQHPEKQKTLIHTAPVLSPVLAPALATPTSSSSAGSAIRAVRSRGRDDALKNNKEVRAKTPRHR